MTLSEVRSAVHNSPNKDWLDKNARAVINLPHIHVQEDLVGVTTVYEFISRECSNWSAKKESLPSPLERSKGHFKEIMSDLQTFIRNHVNQERNPGQIGSAWNTIQKKIETGNRNNESIFIAQAPETHFLTALHKELPTGVNGAVDYLTQRMKQNQFANPDYFTGILQAYEWKLADKSALKQARKSQKTNVGTLRSQFNQYLKEAEENLGQHLQKTKSEAKEATTAMDELVGDKRADFESWFDDTQSKFNTFNSTSEDSIKNLEELYEEKLRLQKPADYWNRRAQKLRGIGNRWMAGLTIVVLISVYLLYKLLVSFTDEDLEKIFSNTGLAIKWSVILISLISFLAYLMRTFTKMTFSSFHLVRDAEEREKLTYVYLALLEKQAVDPKERTLILQSLFSRADSGLLKDDSSPTMPGTLVDRFIPKNL